MRARHDGLVNPGDISEFKRFFGIFVTLADAELNFNLLQNVLRPFIASTVSKI